MHLQWSREEEYAVTTLMGIIIYAYWSAVICEPNTKPRDIDGALSQGTPPI